MVSSEIDSGNNLDLLVRDTRAFIKCAIGVTIKFNNFLNAGILY